MLPGHEDRGMGAQRSLLLQEGLQGRAVGLKSRGAQLVTQAHITHMQQRILHLEESLKGLAGVALVTPVVPGVSDGIEKPLRVRWCQGFTFVGLPTSLAVGALKTVGNNLLLKQGKGTADAFNEGFFYGLIHNGYCFPVFELCHRLSHV